ncbi:M16 family metallopeptidase [Hufsiella ginkgonis]|uniref:Insulinase family protein n=1 Tax=Hufsiella ginkgonis TaxID=2695274 RepID=A0A7K1XUK2_9SPHI|nr:insulinase family protein [Hufsiella ginkgonis]MXV14640.1 insulinase family protein [Hufsiella ginkgonis]
MKSKFLTLILLAAAAGYQLANAQVAPSKTAATQALPLDAAVRTGKLANGFTYYIRKNVEPKNRVQLYLANKVGSILETDEQQGLAHFMEHMSFNGTTHYPKNALVDYLQKSGVRFGADLNAYTGFDETVYQLPLPTDDAAILKNGFQIMRDWAQEALLDPSEINKERGVVLEEKRLGKGADERMQNKYLPMLFNNSRYANRLPIGTEEVLKTFKPETIRKFYKDWYRPNLQALIVVGDIDVNQVEQLIKTRFSDLKNPAAPKPRTKYTIPLTGKNQFITVTDPEMPSTVMQIIVKHPGRDIKTTADLRNSIVRSLYNQMIGARFSELGKQANPPYIQGGNNISGFLAGLDAASSFIVARPGELEKGFKAVLTETERVKKFGFTESELERAKSSYMTNLESAYKERGKTSSENYVQEYLQLFLNGDASPGIEYEYNFNQKNVKGITLAEVNDIAKKYLVDVNRDVIIMGPEKDAATLPSEARVNDWIKSVQQENIVAYKDEVNTKPLLPVKPTAGKITGEKKIAELGITELTLSNGVKVVLKPTDYKNDEIQFTSFSPGGSSLYSDADYQSAASAASLIGRSGAGDYSSVQLTKYLTGKQAFVVPYISERFEGINGFAAPRDLETALQLLYLYFTAPRKDPEIFQGTISRSKASLANRGSDPNSVFSDTIAAVMGNYNVRRTGPSLEKISQVNLDRAYDIYKERFADAGDFTFTFVGSFEVEALKPLLERYLGALPSAGRKEEARDLGIIPPKGRVTKTVNKGKEPKASVRMVIGGDYVYSEENNNQVDALEEILQITLIQRLREEESGVYSPGVSAAYSKNPRSRYNFTITFGCAPENVDKLVAATFDELNKIRQNGPKQADLDKFLAEEQRTTETQLKQNDFWLSYISGKYQNNENPKEVLSYLDDLKKITIQGLKEAANKYWGGENYIRFQLLPETK